MSVKRKTSDDSLQPAQKHLRRMASKRSMNTNEESLQSSRKMTRHNYAAGVIEKIKLENFMCHSSLTLEPNGNINFITGDNGAGKSSLLQGLVLGLLGDAKHTKRYSNIASFIKKDSSKAVIEVTLNNEGEDAFKPDVYGKSITFVRTINQSGQSSVVLKDAQGDVKEAQTKQAREEGKRILEALRIQVENPVIVLQQDEAKEMLKIENPHNLYQFFIKATMIDQVIEQYKAGKIDIDSTRRRESKLKTILKHMKKELKDLNELIKRDEYDVEEYNKLKGEAYWAVVKEQGEIVNDVHKTLEEKRKQLSIIQDKLNALDDELQRLKDTRLESEIKLEEGRNMFSAQEEELETLKNRITAVKQVERTTIAELRSCDDAITKSRTEHRHIKEQLESLSGQSLKDRKIEEIQKENNKAALRTKIDETCQLKLKELERRVQLDNQENDLVQSLENLNSEKKELDNRVNSIKKEIREIEKLGSNNLAVYGQKHRLVEKEIQNNLNLFEKKPFGPVGRFIQLKPPATPNSELADLLESVLCPVLFNYLCTNDSDRRILTKIFNQVFGDGFKPKIVVSKFLASRHKVQKAVLHPNAHVLMDLLDIEEVAVFNFLVDTMNIESVAVCFSQDIAKKITSRRENVPKNLQYAITTDFYRFIPPSSTSSYRSYFLEKKVQGLLSGGTAQQLRQKRQVLETTKSSLNENGREMIKVQKERAEMDKKRSCINNRIQAFEKIIANDKIKLQELSIKSECDTSQSLMERLTLKNQQRMKLESKREEFLIKKSETDEELKTVTSTRDIKVNELNKLKEKWSTLDSQYAKSNVVYVNKCKEIANQEKLVKKLNDDIQNLTNKRETAIEEHKKLKASALEKTKGEILQPSDTKRQLAAKMKKCEERLDERNSDKESIETRKNRQMKRNNLSKEYIHLQKKVKTQEDLLTQVEDINNERRNMVVLIRKRIINMVTRKFNHITMEMAKDIGCTISLRINITKKELRFDFKKDSEPLNTNINSLSGGEKSFAQMALICSLWDHIQPPFRCLDEWDVFLDQVNRDTIQKKLCAFGLRQADKQFIFLSPQSAADYSDMSPEERRKVDVFHFKKS